MPSRAWRCCTRPQAPARRWWPFPNWACRPTPATTCSTSARCSTAARPRWRAWSRPAKASTPWPCSGCPCAWTTRCSTARPCCTAAGCSAWCPRPTCRTTASSTRRGSSTRPTMRRPREVQPARPDRALRRGAAVRGHEPAALQVPRRDLRGPVGADPALVVRGAGRRHAAAQPVGVEHHRRQVGLPAWPGRVAIGALPGGVPVFVGGPGRIDHRPGLGRPVADLRERPAAGRVAALCRGLAPDHGRRRPGTAGARTPAPDQLRPVGGAPCRSAGALSLRALHVERCRPRPPLRRSVERYPYVPADRAQRDDRCHEVYNIQVQGLAQRLRPAASRSW